MPPPRFREGWWDDPRLRAIGWRTVAALDPADSAAALGCTHRLDGAEVVRL